MHSKAIISEMIGLLVCTLVLIVPVNGRFLGISEDPSQKLFRETNVPGLTHTDVLHTLKQVEKPDEVVICGVTVTRLLKYEATSCKFEYLSNPVLLERPGCDGNQGLETFLRHCADELNKSCDENYFKILAEGFEEIPPEDVSKFKLLEKKVMFVRPNIVEKAKKSMAEWEQDEIFPSCVRLVQKMSVAVKDLRWCNKREDEVKKPTGYQYWYNVLERCRIYTETQCEPYSSEPSEPAQSARDTSPQLFERIKHCYEIRNEAPSDRAKKLMAEKDKESTKKRKQFEKESEIKSNNKYMFNQRKLIFK